MYRIALAHDEDFEGWRDAARALAIAGVHPVDVVWQVGDAAPDLFAGEAEANQMPSAPEGAQFSVPRAFPQLAETVVCHADRERFALLYALLVELRTQPKLLEDRAHPLVRRLDEMAKSVRRDIHKMRAFVRFRAVESPEGPRYIAWFEPEHHIVRRNAEFFVRRFANMLWSILTPELCAHWNGEALSFTPGATRADAPSGDPLEETWKTYYAAIFNPARVKVKAMTAEMPKKYWKNMPETALVGELLASARARETGMIEMARDRREIGSNSAAALAALAEEAAGCTRCPLYRDATQTVFGEGPADARIFFMGEVPGDQEDLAGRPFVGPAGQLFDRALGEAGIDRAKTYVTNAVKHFRFVQRGKRRLHQTPETPHIEACRWWWEQERDIVRPALTVALGGTAARALMGKPVTIGRMR
ncbi:MAG: UdgX family uracil-DNA binding protein, partial [Sphingomonadaceae bacterium]|nr:UdgX family uracil-DNA binding protein [Sphingomonadaceae bacterium]